MRIRSISVDRTFRVRERLVIDKSWYHDDRFIRFAKHFRCQYLLVQKICFARHEKHSCLASIEGSQSLWLRWTGNFYCRLSYKPVFAQWLDDILSLNFISLATAFPRCKYRARAILTWRFSSHIFAKARRSSAIVHEIRRSSSRVLTRLDNSLFNKEIRKSNARSHFLSAVLSAW